MNTMNTKLALGCMGMSGSYGATDDAESIRTIQHAIERGVTFLDTGDFYGMGHNEMLIGKAIAGRRDKVQLSVKFGALRGPDGNWFGFDARPAAVKNFLAYSLKRLGVEAIDVYRPGRLDPQTPIEETIGAIAEMVKAGYVKSIGLSEVGVDTIRRAHAVHPIRDLQIEYSFASRGPETSIFPVLKELGIGATLYGVYSRGLLTGSKPKGPGDFRSHLPRFTGANGEKNEAVVAAFHKFAAERKMTPGQLAIAWVSAREPTFTVVAGAKTIAQLDDAIGASEKVLSAAELDALEKIGRITGDRYASQQLLALDSEKK